MFSDIGILGTGLWDGPIVENEVFDNEYLQRAQGRDPFRGKRLDDGTIRVAGLELTPGRHNRTIAAIEHSFTDPFRGTTRRRHLPDGMKISAADAEAARHALKSAKVEASQIDAVLAQSLVPDEVNPKNEALIAHQLGIHNGPAWCIDTVCASSLTQMNVGAALIASGQARHVLCVQSVAYTRVIDPGSSAKIMVGDMASAFVLGRQAGARLHFDWKTDGRLHSAISLGWALPSNAPERRYWESSRERLLVRFDDSQQVEVMADLSKYALMVCNQALRKAEMRMEDVELFITHEPISWSGAYMKDVLGLRDEVAFSVYREYANISSSYIPAALHHALREGQLKKGTKLLIFGPAAGYVYGAAAMTW